MSAKRFASLDSFRKPLVKKGSFLPSMILDDSAVIIQRCYRGHRGRRIFRDRSLLSYRTRYQKQFESLEGLQRFKFQQYGAAFILQRWYRSWTSTRKSLWHVKYHRVRRKYIGQKLFLRAIVKSKTIAFTEKDLNSSSACAAAASIILQRIMRGFLGRRRYKAYDWYVKSMHRMEYNASTRMQSVSRMYLAQLRVYPMGLRYRLLVRKIARQAKLIKEVDPMYPEWFDPHARRRSLLYGTLHNGGWDDLDRITAATELIQRHIRKFLARCIFHRLLDERKEQLATQLQRWVVRCIWRRKVARCMRQIRPFLKVIIKKKRQQNNAAVKLQTMMRGFLKRKMVKRILLTRKDSTRRIAVWVSYRFKLRQVRRKLHAKRLACDLLQAGTMMYSLTRLHWYSHYLWMGIKRTKQIEKADHELQRIFSALSLSNGVEIPKVFKLLRDCKGLIAGTFNMNTIELQFTKIKQGVERRMEYTKFLDFLANLAVVKFLDMDPTKTLFEDIAALSQPQPKGAPAPAMDAVTKKASAFKFGSLYGRAALIAKFVDTYITTLPDYEKVLHYLKHKSADEQADAQIKHAVGVLQVFVRNRSFVRRTYADMKKRKQAKVDVIIHKAACAIQGLLKGFMGRRFITKLAQKMYSKFIDGESEREYWFNTRTQNSFWVKPKLLGELDCGTAVRMPTADEMFSVTCTNCEMIHATVYCEQCNAPMCTACYTTIHRTGTRKTHSYILIDNCIQCEFQIGTRYCNTCADLFCDSCFQYIHARGRLRFHAYERFSTVCDCCNQRTARWKEHGHQTLDANETMMRQASMKSKSSFMSTASTTRYKIKMWCTVCYKDEHESFMPEVRKMSPDPPHTALDQLFYYGRAVKKHIENKAIALAKETIERNFQNRKEEMNQRYRNKAALVLQRVYRGHRCRKEAQLFLQARKEIFILRAKEDSVRQSLLYKLKSLLGVRVLLESDTPLERVKKVYPWYMHHIVAVCIENNWTEACRLLVEHEEHLSKMRTQHKSTVKDYVKAEIAAYFARRRYHKACKHYDERAALVETSSDTFKNAEASGAYGEAKLRKLKSGMNRLEKALAKDLAKKQKAETALDEAEQRVIDIIGPRGLQLLVEERRRNGVLLPFKVNLRKNSSLALVQYPLQTMEDMPLSRKGRGSSKSSKSMEEMTLDQYIVGNTIPGQWKTKLKVGERVLIDSVHFTVQPPLNAKKKRRGSKSKSGKEGSSSKKEKKARNPDDSAHSEHSDNSNNSDPSSAKKMSKKASLQSMDSFHTDNSDTTSDPGSREGSEMDNSSSKRSARSGTPTTPVPSGTPAEEATEDHIQLDRPWLLEDVDQVEVYKAVPHIFYMRPLYALRRKLLRTYFTQKTIAIMAITNHKLSGIYSSMCGFFDDDSGTAVMLTKWSHRANEKKNGWLRLSYRKVDMSYDFSLRKSFGKAIWGIGKGIGTTVKMVTNVVKTVNSGAEETPYEYWARSYEKEKVAATLNMGNDQEVALGDIEMDLKAPVEIMREYIHRAFREKLNETIGESFLFTIIDEESNKMTILPREDEYRTLAKIYAVQKVDARTFMSSLAVLLVKDRMRGRVFIPEFAKVEEDKGDVAEGSEDEKEEEEDDMEMHRLLKPK